MLPKDTAQTEGDGQRQVIEPILSQAAGAWPTAKVVGKASDQRWGGGRRELQQRGERDRGSEGCGRRKSTFSMRGWDGAYTGHHPVKQKLEKKKRWDDKVLLVILPKKSCRRGKPCRKGDWGLGAGV